MATKYEALKRSAGRFEFAPGQLLDLDRGEAKELLADGAVRLVEVDADGEVRPLVTAKKKEKRESTTSGQRSGGVSGQGLTGHNQQSGSSGELDELGEKAVKALNGAGIKSLADAKKHLQDNGTFEAVQGLSKLAAEQLREKIE